MCTESCKLKYNSSKRDQLLFLTFWIVNSFNGITCLYSLTYFLFHNSSFNTGIVACHMCAFLAFVGLGATVSLLALNREVIHVFNTLIALHGQLVQRK